MDSSWAFCRTSATADVWRCLSDNLKARIPDASFQEVQDPEDFFPDEESQAGMSKAGWSQIAYYVATRGEWTALCYAAGGDPSDLGEPEALSRSTGEPVAAIEIDDLGLLTMRLYGRGEELCAMGADGAFSRAGKPLSLEEVPALLAPLRANSTPEVLTRASASAWERAEALLSWLDIAESEDGIEYLDPEDLYADGTIVAFRRA